MAGPITIAVDAMSGDTGAEICVPASIEFVRQQPGVRILLVGQREIIEALATTARGGLPAGVEIHDAREIVAMSERPADALRKKKDSSMRVAVDLVKNGLANACVSAGNTGALMATGRFVLKTLPGIERPAIMARLPTRHGAIYMLDLGANADCTVDQLYQFAVMGSVVARVTEGIDRPRIGLLNIGEEDIKGNEIVKQAAVRLAASRLHYVGFVEADAIQDDRADVIVCDGFSGNVALKSMEGTAKLIRHFLELEFRGSLYGQLAGLVAWPILNSLGRRLDPRRYNGASLVGLDGIVIKSHGGADVLAFQQAISVAHVEAEKRVPDQIRELLSEQVT
ncbi:MAG: phosphate acyltransferase PlsX [Gammaproteobacteria bacterium]|nr:phosphate acyltransferase PlsX [Gammaproteobacteria bacterium]